MNTSSIQGILDVLVPEDNKLHIEDLEGNTYTAKLNFPIKATTKCMRALTGIADAADDGASIQDVLLNALNSEAGEDALETMFLAMYGKTIWVQAQKKNEDAESPLEIFDVGEFLNALAVGVGKQSSRISATVLRVVEALEAAVKKAEKADVDESEQK